MRYIILSLCLFCFSSNSFAKELYKFRRDITSYKTISLKQLAEEGHATILAEMRPGERYGKFKPHSRWKDMFYCTRYVEGSNDICELGAKVIVYATFVPNDFAYDEPVFYKVLTTHDWNYKTKSCGGPAYPRTMFTSDQEEAEFFCNSPAIKVSEEFQIIYDDFKKPDSCFYYGWYKCE